MLPEKAAGKLGRMLHDADWNRRGKPAGCRWFQPGAILRDRLRQAAPNLFARMVATKK
jgi:hypothetical protein